MNPPPSTYAASGTGPPRMVYPARRPAPPPSGRPSGPDPSPQTAGAVDRAVVLAPARFEDFYEADRIRLGRAIAFALGDADLAAEATDEAFTRAYERWPSVSQGNPPAWVYRVAMNWALSVLRRRRRSLQPLYDPAVAAPGVAEPAVTAALAELDPKHRSVVVCRHLLGWSVAETAAALHLREGTVKSRLSRANQILQSRLSHLRPSEEQS